MANTATMRTMPARGSRAGGVQPPRKSGGKPRADAKAATGAKGASPKGQVRKTRVKSPAAAEAAPPPVQEVATPPAPPALPATEAATEGVRGRPFWSRPADPDTIGGRLLLRRQQLGLQQVDVAARMGVARAAYSQYETNTVPPALDKIAKAAKALETSEWYLAYGIGEATRNDELDFDHRTQEWFVRRHWSLNEDWLQQRMRHVSPNDIVLVESPTPTNNVHHGEMLIVVKANKKPWTTPDEYVFVEGGRAQVAQLQQGERGGVVIHSTDGRSHRTVQDSEIDILGKVCGSIQTD